MPDYPRYEFTEYRSGAECVLVIWAGQLGVVQHPNCPVAADIIPEVNAFYCMECRSWGWISGRWVRQTVAGQLGLAEPETDSAS